jgi:hypothetical protein
MSEPNIYDALREARAGLKGEALRGALSYECHARSCPVRRAVLYIEEGHGRRPAQEPMLCPRCREPLMFVKLDLR